MEKFFYIFFSSLTSTLILKFIIPFLRKFELIDIPNHRSSHKKTQVNAGGLSFIFTTLISSLLQSNLEILIIFPMAVIGFLDDKYKISSILRFIMQAFTVFALLYVSEIYKYLLFDNSSILNYIFFGFLIFFGVGLINCINFMDGIDGLVGISVIPALLLIAITFCEPAYALIGGVIGFLIWNWHPSKVFMGDTGSLFLGSFLCYAIYNSPTFELGISICLILSPLILDSGFTLIKRIIDKENIFKAHKQHLYQKLEQYGFKHSTISLIYFLSSLFLTLIFYLTGFYGLIFGTLIIFNFGLYLYQNYTKKIKNH